LGVKHWKRGAEKAIAQEKMKITIAIRDSWVFAFFPRFPVRAGASAKSFFLNKRFLTRGLIGRFPLNHPLHLNFNYKMALILVRDMGFIPLNPQNRRWKPKKAFSDHKIGKKT
jgi:hypothetical protein